MNLLKNVRFSHKFAILGLTLIVTAVAVVCSIFIVLTDLATNSDRGWQRIVAAAYVSEAGKIRENIAILVSTILAGDIEGSSVTEKADPQRNLQDLATQFRTSLQNAENVLTGSDQERFATARSNLEPVLVAYIQISDELLTLMGKGQFEAALAEQQRLTGSFIQVGAFMRHLNEALSAEAALLQKQAHEDIASARKAVIQGVVGGITFILVVLFLITRSITVPMATLTQAASRIAAGDIDQRVTYASGDEIGTLASAFRDLIQYLQEMAQAADTLSKGDLTVEITSRSEQDMLAQSFRRMVYNLRTINGKVKNSAQVVATSIEQIFSSVAELTTCVTETATSVSQTATTVERVKQAAYVASQKANDIAAGAQQTAEVSQSGEHAVATAIAGMNHVRVQMESISLSVGKLGEQSQVVEDIITAVGELAEKLNLLAVNAAIEASKAGEHGRGFAVVAQEVKTLAGKSKQATIRVRTILNEIQKSANVAGVVTEQGVKSVEVGVQQSLDAGESIRILAKGISEAAYAVTQIAASSQEQLIGMGQVGTAMEKISQTSAQNANGMRQIHRATQNLHQVGHTLTELVEQFKLIKRVPPQQLT